MQTSGAFPDWHGTTILAVRKGGSTVIAGDGQVSMGQTIVKGNARKVRRLAGGKVVAGFAGATADAFTLIERLETMLEQYPDQLARACVDLAKDWRTDRYLRRLEAMLIAADAHSIFTLSGVGDVLEPEYGVAAIGSGGAFALAAARALSDHLTPRTKAYHEIWIDGELAAGGEPDVEPIYGKTYLPRKFKIVVAVPPSNDVDIFGQDLGFIAVPNENAGPGEPRLAGFNITVGGGLGMSHNQVETFPRVADVLGFCRPDQLADIAEKIVMVQRDYGDRTDRKHARLKYTIADRGLAWFRTELQSRLGYELATPRRFEFTHTGDRYGWVDGIGGASHYTLFIENGRVKDTPGYAMKTGLREIAKVHRGDFRLTPNQHLMIAGVTPAERPRIEELLRVHKLDRANNATGLRLGSMACVALPTCGLALAESERYLPDLITELDTEVEAAGLRDDGIIIRMTGCPNGCGRPYLAEIAFVGRAPGKYNVYLGAAFNGSRMNALYRPSVPSAELAPLLRPILRRYAVERNAGERFGDFVIRAGYVKPTGTPIDFHEPDKVAGTQI